MGEEMHEKKRVPAIRFAGFTEPWEQRKLENLAVFNPKENLPDEFEYVDLESVVETEMLSHRTEKKATAPSRAQRLARLGDVFYQTVRPYQKNNYLFEKTDKYYVFSTGYAQLRPYNDGYFLFSLVQCESFVKVVLDHCTGTSYPAINSNDLAKINVFAPINAHEHKKIGKIFRNLDNLITLHQRKCDALKKVKKSLLQKMFPKEGSVVPEIRFAGFTEAWEQRKFGDLYERVTEKNDLTYGIDKSITVASMQYKKDGCITNEDYLRTYTICLLGDIVFEGHQSKQFRFGRFVENDLGNGIVSHIFMVFRPKTDYDLYFWKYAINNEQLMRKILSHCTKASRMMNDLVIQDFFKESMPVPTINEQQMIGHFFYKLDQLITLHQRKLDQLKTIKKSLLQQMFV
ncbi:restriction endonuclease subunit S [Megasphaera stantonii]|uniref:Restriction endonuclease subunit S n=2 Tax=Megasphaera stantonii TaxID=2144175 RepID=A0A346B270_9FIRM|nr:restriction endonuclease subunit S [Megasphaera stantonii]